MRFILALVIAQLCWASAGVAATDLGLMRFSFIRGNVQVSAEGEGRRSVAALNRPIRQGDEIWVPAEGRAELRLKGGGFVRLDGSSSLDVIELEGEVASFYLESGRLYINARPSGVIGIFVETPHTSIEPVNGAAVAVDVSEGTGTRLVVRQEDVYVVGGSGELKVSAGTLLTISDKGEELLVAGEDDEWLTWNSRRDRRLERFGAASREFLPPELAGDADELDENGRWLFLEEYGNVWLPRLAVPTGWAPYRYGDWLWLEGNFVWISSEPWGWIPHHYGRWVHLPREGWCWVPPAPGNVYWGPGYVGWATTPAITAWVPLAPADIYYGYGSYGAKSVDLGSGEESPAVSRSYRNLQVDDALTVVHPDTLARGKRKERPRPKSNPFLRQDAVLGPPLFKPGAGGMGKKGELKQGEAAGSHPKKQKAKLPKRKPERKKIPEKLERSAAEPVPAEKPKPAPVVAPAPASSPDGRLIRRPIPWGERNVTGRPAGGEGKP